MPEARLAPPNSATSHPILAATIPMATGPRRGSARFTWVRFLTPRPNVTDSTIAAASKPTPTAATPMKRRSGSVTAKITAVPRVAARSGVDASPTA